ncbi:hypothetical protein JFJ09_11285 [Pseudoalteromonas arctica]|uniref:hypothetical protein n=1 Tax=Pseudoalteromonas TaxID=53246 RepID=UPI0018CE9FE7|nr:MULTISPECIES: hypothetical protein [Pseudoalteromonas]MBH0015091.1 hypothetical protein [Pseudoalteromonas sp. NGC95]MBZ2192800.1 hypothetical protein [Pseudoalteromonas arctica]
MIIVLPHNKSSLIKDITDGIDRRHVGSLVTILIDKEGFSFTLIVGQNSLISGCTIKLSTRSTHLKNAQFSIDSAFAKRLPHYFPLEKDIVFHFKTLSSGTSIIELIHVDSDKNKAKSNQDNQSNKITIRICDCQEASEKHLTHFEDIKQLPTKKIRKAAIERMVYEIKKLHHGDNLSEVFEYIEIDVEKQVIKVQIAGRVSEIFLPKEINLPISIVMTQESFNQFDSLCKSIKDDEIGVVQQGELLILQTAEGVITCSLAGADEFHAKEPEETLSLISMILNLKIFKDEVNHCVNNYVTIKKADQAYLYLDNNRAVIAILTSPYKFAKPLHLKEIDNKKEGAISSLFRFSPKDLLKVKIKNSVNDYATQLQVIQHLNGELKLGVFCSENNGLPYHTISIEKDNSQLSEVVAMLENLDKTQYLQQKGQGELDV